MTNFGWIYGNGKDFMVLDKVVLLSLIDQGQDIFAEDRKRINLISSSYEIETQ
jgi:hypothetical protein